MQNNICSMLLLVILSVVACLRMQKCSSTSEMHTFDLNATLPLRGILAIVIICVHLDIFPNGPFPIFRYAGSICVAVFFFISGYGLMVSYLKRGNAYLTHFFRHRFGKVLPAFVCLTVVMFAFKLFYDHVPLTETLRTLVVKGVPPLRFSWFMYAIIVQYVAFFIACRFGRSKVKCIVVAALLTLAFMAVVYVANYGFWWWNVQPSFVIGLAVAAYEKELRAFVMAHKSAILLPMALVLAVCVVRRDFHLPGLLAMLLPNLAPLVVLFCVYAFGSISGKIVKYLGKISLEIYLVQGIAFLFAGYFHLQCYAFALVVFALTLPMAVVAHKFSEKVAAHF